MKNLESYFHKSFGIPIPKIILPDTKLVPLDNENPDEAYLFGSPIALEKTYLIQADLEPFINWCPEGYFLIGFWGHGANSYAFYYSRVDSWSNILFRLPYGGVYMDNEENAEYIREFLTRYFDFEKKLKREVNHLIAIESMGRELYEIVKPDGTRWETKESFFGNPNFDERFFQSLTMKKEPRIDYRASKAITEALHDDDLIRNWKRLCITINGFRAKFGKWPKRVTSHDYLIDDIKKHILSDDSFRKLQQKIEIITRDETSENHAILAEDEDGSIFKYGEDGGNALLHSGSRAEEWLGIRPDRVGNND